MKLINHSEVLLAVGDISRTTLHAWRTDPAKAFPKPASESPLLWFDEDIFAWIRAASEKANAARPDLDQAVHDMAAGAGSAGK